MTFDVNAPEVQEAIKAAVEEATNALVAKNRELLGEVKKLKRGPEIDQKVVDDLEAQIDKLQADLSEAQKQSKEAAKQLDTVNKQLESESGFTQKLLIDNGLLETLAKNGVTNPIHQKAAAAMLRGNLAIVADGDKRVVKAGEKLLDEYIKEWAGGDEGKHFVSAPLNSGAGAPGSNGKGSPNLSKLSPVERITAARAAKT